MKHTALLSKIKLTDGASAAALSLILLIISEIKAYSGLRVVMSVCRK
jgi:hypothetical protein